MRAFTRFYPWLSIGLLTLLAASFALAQESTPEPGPSLPPLPITTDYQYTIVFGDTLENIAAIFDVDRECLRDSNNILVGQTIFPGEVITVPVSCPAYNGTLPVEVPRFETTEAEAELLGAGGGGGTYVVQYGDTLDEIAQAFDVSLVSLRLANDNLTSLDMIPGLELLIPADAPPYGQFPAIVSEDSTQGAGGGAEDGAAIEGDQYVVQPGDTLDTIAQEFDVSLVSLRIANGFEDTSVLMPGMVLIIPADAPAYGVFPAIVSAQGEDDEDETAGQGGGAVTGGTYIIQPGDTLDTIAQELNISLVSLQIENDLQDDSTIFPGQVLTIPEDAPAYGVFPALTGGQGGGAEDDEDESEETVPLAESTEEAGQGGGAEDGGGEGEEYVVQPGDTLDTIAQEYNVSIVSLRIANDLEDDSTIFPGTVLIIPADAVPYGQFPPIIDDETLGAGGGFEGETYVVQPGDTLDTIAQELNISVISLRLSNELEEDSTIFPGTVLIIPEDAPGYGQFPALTQPDESLGAGGGLPEGDQYIVQPGDTLDTIGQEFNVSVVSLQISNGLENSRLMPGMVLIIPADAPAYGLVPAIVTPDSTLGAGGGVDGEVYVMQYGDTLDEVGQIYDALPQCLIEANEIENTRLIRPGTPIVIPASCPPYRTLPPEPTPFPTPESAG
jgi:LysM repeat protein